MCNTYHVILAHAHCSERHGRHSHHQWGLAHARPKEAAVVFAWLLGIIAWKVNTIIILASSSSMEFEAPKGMESEEFEAPIASKGKEANKRNSQTSR